MAYPTGARTDDSTPYRQALRLALGYALAAAIWLSLAARMPAWLWPDSAQATLARTAMVWLLPALTALLLFVTTRRQAEYARQLAMQRDSAREAGQRSEARYRVLMDEAVPDGIFIHDHQGHFVEVNRRACESVGYAREDLLRMSVTDLEQDFDLARAQAEWSSIQSQQMFRLRGHHLHSSGRSFPVEVQFGLLSEQGERLYVATVRDISDQIAAETARSEVAAVIEEQRRELEETVRLQTAQFADLYNHAPCGYHSLNADGVFINVNDTELEWLGYTRGELVGVMHVTSILTPASREIFRNTFPRLLRGEPASIVEGTGLELEFVRRDGSVVPVLVHARMVFDAQGRFLHSLVSCIDNTARKAYEHRILELNRLLNEMLEALPVGVAAFDRDLGLQLRNQLFRTLLDLPPELAEAQSVHLEEMVRYAFDRGDYDPRGYQTVLAHYSALLRSRQPFKFERELPGGKHLEIQGTPLSGESVLLTYRDISAARHAERTLQEARAAAEAATLAKSDFLANMSHEIRTPINGILGLCYLIDRQDLTPAVREMLGRLRMAGQSLLAIINDILDFSKIEAGRLETEMVPFHLSEVLDNLASMMASTIGEKPVELIMGPVPAGSEYLVGDPLRLTQVLINLAGNAIKFTNRGEIVVRVAAKEADSDVQARSSVRLEFSVSDTGVGIAPDKLHDIFSPFEQGDSSTTRRFGGTGLGLAISRRLVELMGGILEVESALGKGSRFAFVLELTRSPASDKALPALACQRLLIADDQPTSREVLALTAQSLGWEAVAVPSGERAIECFRTDPSGYDVVLLDWRMPVLNGLQTAERIRAQSDADCAPIVIMVTAHDRFLLQQEASAGMVDGVLTKPVTSSSLYAVVEEVKRRRGRLALETAPPSTTKLLAGLRILVVDDSDLNRDVARSILLDQGASVAVASDGAGALAALAAPGRKFDVVLMDMQMPGMDGYEATRRIRADPVLHQLPVLALTAGAFRAQRDLALRAGVDDYVAKPFDVGQLVTTILRCARGDPQEPQLPGHVQLSARRGDPGADQLPGLDIGRAREVWADERRYASFLRRFVQEYEAIVPLMRQGTVATAEALAHKLQGAAGSLYLTDVAARAADLEHALHEQRAVAAHFEALQVAIEIAVDSIGKWLQREAGSPHDSAVSACSDDLAELLRRLLRELDTDEPDRVDPILAVVRKLLPADQCATVSAAVEAYDFRGAETAVRRLAETLGVMIEEQG